MRTKTLLIVFLTLGLGGSARADKILSAAVSGSLTQRDNQFCGTAGNALVLTFPELTQIDDVVFKASFEGRVEVTASDGSMVTVPTLTSSGAFTDAKILAAKAKNVTLRFTQVGGDSVPCVSDIGFLNHGKPLTVIIGVDQKAIDAIGTELVAVRKAMTSCDPDQIKKVAKFPVRWKHLKADTSHAEPDEKEAGGDAPGLQLDTVEFPDAVGMARACKGGELPAYGDVGVTGGAPGQMVLEKAQQSANGAQVKWTFEWSRDHWVLVGLMSRDAVMD